MRPGLDADTAASAPRFASPAKQRRMPGLWRTVQQQLRKASSTAGTNPAPAPCPGRPSAGSANAAADQIRRTSLTPSPLRVATVPSPERPKLISPSVHPVAGLSIATFPCAQVMLTLVGHIIALSKEWVVPEQISFLNKNNSATTGQCPALRTRSAISVLLAF